MGSGCRLFLPEGLHEAVVGRPVGQDPPRIVIHPLLDPEAVSLAHRADGFPLREEAADEPVLVLAGPALPGAVGMAEVDVRHILERRMEPREFGAIVGSDGLEELGEGIPGAFPQTLDRLIHGAGILSVQLQDDLETSAPLHQRQEDGIRLGPVPNDGIDLPMAELFPVFHRLRALRDGAAQDPVVGALAALGFPRLAGQLLEQVQVGGLHDPAVDPLVERGGGGD